MSPLCLEHSDPGKGNCAMKEDAGHFGGLNRKNEFCLSVTGNWHKNLNIAGGVKCVSRLNQI